MTFLNFRRVDFIVIKCYDWILNFPRKDGTMLKSYTIDGFENIQYQGYHALLDIEQRLGECFKRHGYRRVTTPTFEAYDIYMDDDAVPRDDLFKLVSRKGKVLALKPDATLSVARMAAINHHDPGEIIKFYYLTNIYRHFSDPDVKKEITQMGVEYFGDNSPECDAQIIRLALKSLELFHIEKLQIDLGNVGLIDALLTKTDLDADARKALGKLIDKKNVDDILDFAKTHGIDEAIADKLARVTTIYGKPEAVLEKTEALCENTAMRRAAAHLKAVYRLLCSFGLGDAVTIDLGFTRTMNYYTDTVFKVYGAHWGAPLIEGGRYDALSAKFGIDRPACGFAVDVLGLMDYLEQNDLILPFSEARTVLFYAPDDIKRAADIADSLRERGVITETFPLKGAPEPVIARMGHTGSYKNARFYCIRQGEVLKWQQNRFDRVDDIDGVRLYPADPAGSPVPHRLV